MSLRGEQDDLNWYEFIGPNVPHNTYEKKPVETAPAPGSSNYGPMPNDVTGGMNHSEKSASEVAETKVEVVKVTVDGRFGHDKNASNGENIKTMITTDMEQMVRVEGLLESATDAVEV